MKFYRNIVLLFLITVSVIELFDYRYSALNMPCEMNFGRAAYASTSQAGSWLPPETWGDNARAIPSLKSVICVPYKTSTPGHQFNQQTNIEKRLIKKRKTEIAGKQVSRDKSVIICLPGFVPKHICNTIPYDGLGSFLLQFMRC